ncbi:YraN family protein [Tropicibacter sp. R16_0]|uniref:YraN family protein n=1 Tax=Tropicibacter sp. R16_0 TaxID=2821102 RepID=UPI001ADCB796|nr:YraN family protein [Tropicibacter sp. R16_0]MBO9450897.1 YraN family protein [Tropicibacter sp. R16_0]
MTAQVWRGSMAHYAGDAAEQIVARTYAELGLKLTETRWRGQAGEIDLILRDGDAVVFVEVKKSRNLDQAALRLGPRQIERIYAAGAEFLANEPKGQLTEARFDVALVDGTGQVQILENAIGMG